MKTKTKPREPDKHCQPSQFQWLQLSRFRSHGTHQLWKHLLLPSAAETGINKARLPGYLSTPQVVPIASIGLKLIDKEIRISVDRGYESEPTRHTYASAERWLTIGDYMAYLVVRAPRDSNDMQCSMTSSGVWSSEIKFQHRTNQLA